MYDLLVYWTECSIAFHVTMYTVGSNPAAVNLAFDTIDTQMLVTYLSDRLNLVSGLTPTPIILTTIKGDHCFPSI